MGSQYAIRDNESIYFITGTVVDWVDVFTRNDYCIIFTDSVNFCINEKGLKVHAWVLMSNHFHALVSTKEGYILSVIMRDMLKFQSKKIVKAISENAKESRREWMMHRFEWNGKQHYSNTKSHIGRICDSFGLILRFQRDTNCLFNGRHRRYRISNESQIRPITYKAIKEVVYLYILYLFNLTSPFSKAIPISIQATCSFS